MKLLKAIIILSSLVFLTNCSSTGQKVKLTPGEVNGSILSDPVYMPTPITLGEGYKAQIPAYFWNGVQYMRFTLRTNEKLLHHISLDRPGCFNQAIMDLGREVCKPQNPICEKCPISKFCKAFKNKTILNYPVKKKLKKTPLFDVVVGYIQNQHNKDEVEAIIQGDMENILNIAKKSKTGPELALVEGVIPNKIISNATYSGFIVKYDNK